MLMWKKLAGKTYPDTAAEQLASLETDETLRDYKKRREAWARDPYRPIYHMSSSSLRTDLVGKPPKNAPFRLSSDGKVRLRIFLDRSLIEVFADNGECLPEWAFPRKGIDKLFPLFSQQCAVARVYPLQGESNGLSLFAIGGEAKVVSMDVWQMHSIWPELKYREGA